MKNVIVCSMCVNEWIDCPHPTLCATEITSLDYQLQKARREIAENDKKAHRENETGNEYFFSGSAHPWAHTPKTD